MAKLLMKVLFITIKSAFNSFIIFFVVFESTGVYSKPLERFLTDYDIDYKLVNPLALHLKLQTLRQNKTDVSDARALASIADDPTFAVKPNTKNVYQQLKTLSNNYIQVVKDIRIFSNRVRRGLELSFPEMNKLFNPITSILALLLSDYSLIQTL